MEFIKDYWSQIFVLIGALVAAVKMNTAMQTLRRDVDVLDKDIKRRDTYVETVKLRAEVQALPTRTAREWMDGSWKSCMNCRFHHTLGRQIHIAVRSLPTPTTMDHLPQRSAESMKKQATEHRKGRTQLANLREAVNPQAVDLFNQFQTLPTPTAHEHKATGQKNTSQSGQMLSSIARRGELSEETGLDMFLNPAFVEEMMGYEVGWPALNL